MKKVIASLSALGFQQSWAAGGPDWESTVGWQWLGGLLMVVALIFVCLWVLQRLGRWGQGSGGQIRLLGGLSLGGREKLLVVAVGETQLVIGVSPGRVQTLCILEAEQRLLARKESGFGQRLNQALTNRQEEHP